MRKLDTIGEVIMVTKDFIEEYKTKKEQAIYFLLHNDEIVYVGETTNFYSRIGAHAKDVNKQYETVMKIALHTHTTKKERLAYESYFIAFYLPKINIENMQRGTGRSREQIINSYIYTANQELNLGLLDLPVNDELIYKDYFAGMIGRCESEYGSCNYDGEYLLLDGHINLLEFIKSDSRMDIDVLNHTMIDMISRGYIHRQWALDRDGNFFSR